MEGGNPRNTAQRRGWVITTGLGLLLLALAGCDSVSMQLALTPLPEQIPSRQPRAYSGTITCVGSSVLAPVLMQAGERFRQAYPLAHILVITATSQSGLAAVLEGGADLGLSDVPPTAFPGLDRATLHDYPLGASIYAVITHPDVGLGNLSRADLSRIYTGQARNWRDVGGPDLPIALVGWPKGAGPRLLFRQFVLTGAAEDDSISLPQGDNQGVAAAVAATPGAIGYVALSAVRPDVRVVMLDGVRPQAEMVRLNQYRFWGISHVYTKGEAGGLAGTFIDYLRNADVQAEFFKPLGFIPVTEMPTTSP